MRYSRITKIAEATLPTTRGVFRILGFEGELAPGVAPGPQRKQVEELVALVYGNIFPNDTVPASSDKAPIVRVHSQCLTGDVFHSLRCDCRQQLDLALDTIVAHGSGLILYEEQEGRGIGLMAKLRAYELQDQGLDTIEANERLGYKPDHRDFSLPAEVLQQMGIHAVRLITNNPEKVTALQNAGIRVTERLSAEVEPNGTSQKYLQIKREKMGHLIGSL